MQCTEYSTLQTWLNTSPFSFFATRFHGLCLVEAYFSTVERKLERYQLFHFGKLKKTEIGAHDTLQHSLFSPSILALVIPKTQYKLDANVCDKEVGYTILQRRLEGKAKPINVCSRLLNKAEQEYDTMPSKCFAVVRDLLLFKSYLEG